MATPWRITTRERCRRSTTDNGKSWSAGCRSKTGQALALRARIVLASAEGESDMSVAARLGTTRETVGKWRRRFIEKGCDGLLDEPRPGAPRTVGDADVERLVTMTLESMPRGATQWSALDGEGVRPEFRDGEPDLAGLRPAAAPRGKPSSSPPIPCSSRRCATSSGAPPERAAVLCVDEKSQIQALESSPSAAPGDTGPADPRLQAPRHHVAVPALDVATGEVIGRLPAPPLRRVQEVPHGHREGGAEGTGGVLDNYTTHKTG